MGAKYDQYDRAQQRRQAVLDLLHQHPDGLSAPQIAAVIGGNAHTVGTTCADMRHIGELAMMQNRKFVALARHTESADVRREKHRGAVAAYRQRQPKDPAQSGPGRIVHLCGDKPIKSTRDGCRRTFVAKGFSSLESI